MDAAEHTKLKVRVELETERRLRVQVRTYVHILDILRSGIELSVRLSDQQFK